MTTEADQPSSGGMTGETIDAKVVRITGEGHIILQPVRGGQDLKIGDQVRILIPGKMMPDITLMLKEERMSAPVSSNWALVVSARQTIALCRVFYNRVQISTIDGTGVLRSEIRMSSQDSITFRIPDFLAADDAYVVEVKDGESVLTSQTLGEIKAAGMPKA